MYKGIDELRELVKANLSLGVMAHQETVAAVLFADDATRYGILTPVSFSNAQLVQGLNDITSVMIDLVGIGTVMREQKAIAKMYREVAVPRLVADGTFPPDALYETETH
jgi:hypothetical protein